MKNEVNLNNTQQGKFPLLVPGIANFARLLGISYSAAYKYCNGVLKDACTRKENNIIFIDTRKALTLLGVSDIERFF